MRESYQCKKCGKKSFWKIRRNHLKCKNCRSENVRKFADCNLPKDHWQKIIHWFVLEQSTNRIQEQTNVSKYYILKSLKLLRQQMLFDIPEIFDGIVEVDETYLGGQWKNKRLSVKSIQVESKRGRGTTKQPVFGILCRSGHIWAELIDGTEAEDLQPIIERKVKAGSTIMSDTWRAYTGIAAKGYVHRLVEHNKEFVSKQGNHINGLEGFWGYLKRKLAAKGGIRKGKLPLFLAEYVWRYNYRRLSIQERENRLYDLITGVSY